MRLIIDAMGGDNAPLEIVKGALAGQKRWGVDVTLTGDTEAILKAVEACGEKTLPQGMEIVHTSEVVEMCDDPATVFRRKKDTSMGVGLQMLREGKGDAVISAGSTGALLTGATLLVKRIRGIRRAAMAPLIPTAAGKAVLIDCGANAECTPEFLLQFGLVGSAYSKNVLGVQQPRVGLLNIGTEDSKGTQLQRDAYALLQNAQEQGLISFVGNVEARAVPLGEVDVVVCDGFSGNVLLKSIEGTAMFMGSLLKRAFKKNLLTKLGYLLCQGGVKNIMKLLDYREIGGTQLLGIKKPVIKAHGASDSLAFRNAVQQAVTAAEGDFTDQLAQDLAVMKERAQ